jgi:hypothetical protein
MIVTETAKKTGSISFDLRCLDANIHMTSNRAPKEVIK